MIWIGPSKASDILIKRCFLSVGCVFSGYFRQAWSPSPDREFSATHDGERAGWKSLVSTGPPSLGCLRPWRGQLNWYCRLHQPRLNIATSISAKVDCQNKYKFTVAIKNLREKYKRDEEDQYECCRNKPASETLKCGQTKKKNNEKVHRKSF